ncbi:MAG: DnaA regulatory inactivator Hda [Gammaproteobacteria bacterium RIFCSPHIGHO2_12_FULL_42_10]|nr:MAG: DnaA regulatory inactivator Hda [Gammaproteobacteria bacterium RIFCSPHIGHO2_12_FULL_42_10]
MNLQTQLPQLTFSLNTRHEATFEYFYSGNNAEIVTQLKKTASGHGEQMIYLHGTRGQGCSYLLQAACHYASLHQLTSVYLPLTHLLTLSKEVLQGLESLSLICIDDLEALVLDPSWEEALFHLYNRIHDAGGHIIMAAHTLPQNLPLTLPDLVSRLSWGVVYAMRPLNDDEKLQVLAIHADRRGIYLSDEAARYLLRHCPRHLRTLLSALDVLDQASLAAKRGITIPFIKEVLEITA